MLHPPILTKGADQFRMVVDDLGDTFPGEGLLPESSLDVIQHLGMGRVVLIQHILELKICRAETVAEVLGEDPSRVCTTEPVSIENRS